MRIICALVLPDEEKQFTAEPSQSFFFKEITHHFPSDVISGRTHGFTADAHMINGTGGVQFLSFNSHICSRQRRWICLPQMREEFIRRARPG